VEDKAVYDHTRFLDGDWWWKVWSSMGSKMSREGQRSSGRRWQKSMLNFRWLLGQ
jgi:hypothetical protein